MLGQSWGAFLLALECVLHVTPDVWIDTTGWAATFIVAKLLAGCRTAAYVHYPTITRVSGGAMACAGLRYDLHWTLHPHVMPLRVRLAQDMIGQVAERRPTYNNAASVSRSALATHVKLAYYRLFAWLYGCMGGLVDLVMVNGSWTKAHIESLWGLPVPVTLRRGSDGASTVVPLDDEVAYRPVMGVLRSLVRATGWQSHTSRPAARLVYPPCNTTALAALPLGGRERLVISVAQFRPEKDHALQLRAFAAFRKMGERSACSVEGGGKGVS